MDIINSLNTDVKDFDEFIQLNYDALVGLPEHILEAFESLVSPSRRPHIENLIERLDKILDDAKSTLLELEGALEDVKI